MSLDYRLREASSIKDMAKDFLKDLDNFLEEGVLSSSWLGFTMYIDNNWTALRAATEDAKPDADVIRDAMNFISEEEGTTDMDPEIASTTPLKEIIKEIGNAITCLYRLSISIQSPASQDRLEKMEKIVMSHFEPFDIEHVRQEQIRTWKRLPVLDRAFRQGEYKTATTTQIPQ